MRLPQIISGLHPTVNGRTDRRRFLRLAIGSAGLFAAPTLLGACRAPIAPAATVPAPATEAAGAPQRGGILRVVYQGEPKQLDPARYVTIEDGNFHEAVYNRLVRQDAKLAVQPDLAASWQVSDDLKTWTFKLREGVTFHHGKAFNADDVVFTFRRIFDPATASAGRSILDFIEGVEKQD